MQWISVKDELPKPFEVVWIFWRDKEILLGCRTYEGEEAVECDPSEGWYSFDYEKCRWCNFWKRIDSSSLDKPIPPKINVMKDNLKIYVHKVRMNPIDGWGNSTGIKVEILGRYSNLEKAKFEKQKRDACPAHLFCDCGNSWIDQEDLE